MMHVALGVPNHGNRSHRTLTIKAIAAAVILACFLSIGRAQTAAPTEQRPTPTAAPTAAKDAAEAVSAAAPTAFKSVVITAQKRPETLTQTPAAVSVFSREDIADRNIYTLSDLGKYVPNLDINRFGAGNPAHAAIFIRGIGLQDHIITTDPSVGVYLDGVYLGRQLDANLNLANIQRVEVLRGPQGTLYGKNTLGGAINIITAQPGDEQVNRIDFRVGSRGRVELGGYTNFNVDDRLSIAATGDATRRNGIGKALLVDAPADVGQLLEYSGRVAVKLKVTNDFSIVASVDAVHGINGKTPTTIDIFDPAAAAQFGVTAAQLPANPDNSNSGQTALFRQTNKGLGGSLTGTWHIDEHLTAKLLTGYRYTSYTGGLDDDNIFPNLESFPERGFARQLSIEPQLNGEYGKLDFVTGLYYGDEKGNTNSGPWFFGGPGGFFDINQTTRSEPPTAMSATRCCPTCASPAACVIPTTPRTPTHCSTSGRRPNAPTAANRGARSPPTSRSATTSEKRSAPTSRSRPATRAVAFRRGRSAVRRPSCRSTRPVRSTTRPA